MFDTQKFIDGVHDYIGKAVAPLRARIDEISNIYSEQMVGVSKELIELRNKAEAMEARAPEKGEKGDKGDAADPAPTIDEVLPPLLEATRGLVDPVVADLKTAGEVILANVERQIGEAIEGMKEIQNTESDDLASKFLEALKQKFEKVD